MKIGKKVVRIFFPHLSQKFSDTLIIEFPELGILCKRARFSAKYVTTELCPFGFAVLLTGANNGQIIIFF